MKFIFLSMLFISSLFACTGDCFTCHPNLLEGIEKDLRHLPMKKCINCHLANPESMSECGPDCFECHSKDKMEEGSVEEHKVIASCRECHMKEKFMDMSKMIEEKNNKDFQGTLKDYLKL